MYWEKEMDLRVEAEQRALLSSSMSPNEGAMCTPSKTRAVDIAALSPLKGQDNETVKAAKLAELDYKWNGSRSRIPSGQFIPPRWVPDQENDRCQGCSCEFDLWNRRHHCRHCGKVFCLPCSSQTCLLPLEFGFRDPQRVCRACNAFLQAQQEDLSQTVANHMCVSQIDVATEGCALRRYRNLPFPGSLNGDLVNAAYAVHNLLQVRFLRDQAIPLGLLQTAKAIVFLSVARAAFFFSGSVGSGLIIRRLPMSQGGGWSAPCAVGSMGLGYGFSAGVEVSDVLLVLRSDEALQALVRPSCLGPAVSLSLGASIAFSVGGLGRGGGLSALLTQDVVTPLSSYGQSRGVFAGISLEGIGLCVRAETNERFYGRPLRAEHILGLCSSAPVPPPRAAAALYSALAEVAAQSPQVVHATASPQITREVYYSSSAAPRSEEQLTAGYYQRGSSIVDTELETATVSLLPSRASV